MKYIVGVSMYSITFGLLILKLYSEEKNSSNKIVEPIEESKYEFKKLEEDTTLSSRKKEVYDYLYNKL
jgi:hypothetical protein